MMYITFHNPVNNAPASLGPGEARKLSSALMLEVTWHVGNKLPFPLNDHNKHLIAAVYADGDELDLVIATAQNLPYVAGCRSATWRGDMAQFIVDNYVK